VAADLGKALAVPLAALQDRVNPPSGAVLVILVSDGELSSKRAAATLAATAKLQDMGARVVVTGTEETSSVLLVAAAEGRLHWHSLSKSDPTQWIADARKAKAALATSTDRHPQAEEQQANPGPTTTHAPPLLTPPPPKADHPKPKAPIAPDPLTEEPGEPTPTPAPPVSRTQGASPLKLQVAGVLTLEENNGTSQSHARTTPAPSLAVPAPPRKVEPASPKSPTAPLHVKDQLPVLPKPKSSTPAPKAAPSQPSLPAPKPPVRGEPATAAGTPTPGEAPPASPRLLPWPWVALGGLLVFAGLVALAGVRARRRSKQQSGVDMVAGKEPKAFQLIVAENGREHVLGPPELVGSVRVGSEATNAVMVNAEGVAGHHVAIARRGRRWRIHNLSAAPVEVNGLELPGRKKLFVPLPTTLKLSDKAHLRVFVRSAATIGSRQASAPANQEHQP